MTKDTAEFSHFTVAVACREYTLPRDEETSEPEGWIRGNTKIWARIGNYDSLPAKGTYGVETRILSLSEDNSHSWVRISYGLNKLVSNLNNNEQETSEVQFEKICVKIECD